MMLMTHSQKARTEQLNISAEPVYGHAACMRIADGVYPQSYLDLQIYE